MQYESLFSEDAANSRYATDSTVFPRLTRFPAFSKARPISWKPSIATAARIPRGFQNERTRRVGCMKFRRIAAERLPH